MSKQIIKTTNMNTTNMNTTNINTTNNNNNTNIILELQDYMFISKNIDRYTKHIIQVSDSIVLRPKSSLKHIDTVTMNSNKSDKSNNKTNNYKAKKETIYKPNQKDSLFWCFYILKNGFSNYEMEINNQYFVVEKNEKFKYIKLFRKNKDILKIHKIKPLTELEDDLANKDKISIKTFFALCIIENINVLLVNKRKVYELLCHDIDKTHPINIIHRNSESYEHYIELEPTNEIIQNYRETYYKMSGFDATLKSMGSYKLEELLDLCKKLDINIDDYKNKKEGKQKLTKKDIYELLVLNY